MQHRRGPRAGPSGPEHDLRSLTDVLDRLVETAGDRTVCVGDVMTAVGPRSFGPMLLTPGLIVLSPLSGIPGLPTVMAAVILLVAGQMLIGRGSVWLPARIRRRCIGRERLDRAVGFLRPVARVTDRVIRPRLCFVTRPPFSRAIAGICILVACTMPVLELVPMANTMAGAAVSTFALALTAQDGALGIAASAITLVALCLGATAIP